MAENYEADLLNENHLKYKSGVSLFTDRLEIIAMLNKSTPPYSGRVIVIGADSLKDTKWLHQYY